jgi:ATP-dependent DNA helicase MPH1
MSPTYDQALAYRHSLFTQPPGRGDGPRFTSKPARRGVFGFQKQTARVDVSSSPPKGQATDQYSMDSFVVEDDDDVLLHEDSHSSSI